MTTGDPAARDQNRDPNSVREPHSDRDRPQNSVPDRDRDPTGRARNARPRDATGRPLPRGAAGVERIPDDLVLPPGDTLDEAQRLLDEGRPFHAHEVLEAAWKSAPATERDLWQGLAQLAVGLTHAQRGNRVGAARLLRRAADRIAPYAAAPPHGIAVVALLGQARELAARFDAGEQLAAGPAGERSQQGEQLAPGAPGARSPVGESTELGAALRLKLRGAGPDPNATSS